MRVDDWYELGLYSHVLEKFDYGSTGKLSSIIWEDGF